MPEDRRMTEQQLIKQGSPAGWYPDHQNPGIQRYWDGVAWTQYVAPILSHQPAVVYVGGFNRPMHVSGLSTGGHAAHAILTVCTLGLWAPIWLLTAFLGRKKIR